MSTKGVKRVIYLVIGTLALFLGALGIFLPVLPTTPFVILAAACYLRSSKRMHAWILQSRLFGETIENFQAGRGLKRATKIRALVLMWATISISAFFFVDQLIFRGAMFIVAAGVTVYLLRLPTLT
ncbi:Inner membrane protein YbaN [subsurface metagenome]